MNYKTIRTIVNHHKTGSRTGDGAAFSVKKVLNFKTRATAECRRNPMDRDNILDFIMFEMLEEEEE